MNEPDINVTAVVVADDAGVSLEAKEDVGEELPRSRRWKWFSGAEAKDKPEKGQASKNEQKEEETDAESFENEIVRLLDEHDADTDEGKKSRLDKLVSWLTIDRVDSAVQVVQKGGECALVVVQAAGKAAEGAVPFIGLANFVIDEIGEVVGSCAHNKKQRGILEQELKPCADIVYNKMLPLVSNVSTADQLHFHKTACGCLKVILSTHDTCVKWERKGSINKVMSAREFEGKFKDLKESLKDYRFNVLLEFLTIMQSSASVAGLAAGTCCSTIRKFFWNYVPRDQLPHRRGR